MKRGGKILENKRTSNGVLNLENCLREMAVIRKSMKKTDAEIRRLEKSTRRKLDETWSVIRSIQATI